jgi:hypothetical protein
MKTPITDAAQAEADKAEAVLAIGIMRRTARRLELDRAALMEALEAMLNLWQKVAGSETDDAVEKADAALISARANFPQP